MRVGLLPVQILQWPLSLLAHSDQTIKLFQRNWQNERPRGRKQPTQRMLVCNN